MLKNTLYRIRRRRDFVIHRRRDARLGDRDIFTTPVAARCATKWLPVFPFLALRLTRRKMMLIHSIGLYVPTGVRIDCALQRTAARPGYYAAIRSVGPGGFRTGIHGYR